MVRLAIAFKELSSEALAGRAKAFGERGERGDVEDFPPIFGYEDEVDVEASDSATASGGRSSERSLGAKHATPKRVLRRQAFKFQLRPNGAQRKKMQRFAGCRRFVYNRALELREHMYREGAVALSYPQLCKDLTRWRAEFPWLKAAPGHALQQALKDLLRGYTNFFEGRADRPSFRKKGRNDAFRLPDGFRVDEGNQRIWLTNIGWVRYRASRRIRGIARNVTVRRRGDRWYVSIQTEFHAEPPVHPSRSAVGIDVGITKFATLSDGTSIRGPNALKAAQKALARAQRTVSRRRKGSKNWRKAKRKVSALHIRIANVRNNFLHKTTTALSKSHASIALEELQVQNMSASASGTVEAPGTNVAQKRGLNRSILDQGWGEFRRQLEYKMAWAGGEVVLVDPKGTSQTCLSCGHRAAESRKRERFRCIECGAQEDADVVGAVNILRRAGRARIA